jgi:hypothetical protein
MRQSIVRQVAVVFAGCLVAWYVPRLVALVLTVPGLRALIDGIRATGLPAQYVFPLLTNYFPIFLLAFVVGLPLFKLVRGNGLWLWVLAVLPWVAYAIYWYVQLCLDTEVSCYGVSPFHEVLGLFSVPLGFALAALVARPTRPPGSNKPVETDAQVRPRVLRSEFLGRRSLLR